jgi:hypothetical protein
MVNVGATGDVTIQASGVQPNASYAWAFCMMAQSCFDLGQTLMTDASGNGQLTFHFPKIGNWAGYFIGTSGSATMDTQDAAHGSMSGALVTENGVNGLPPCNPLCRTDSAQGTVTVANNVAHIVVQGGIPSRRYEVVLWNGGVTQGVINSDANGNVTADVPVQPGHGSTYEITDRSNLGVVTGFTVK